MHEFDLVLSTEEKDFLIEAARARIDQVLRDRRVGAVAPPPEGMVREKFGAFVTLKRNGTLRGCIGRLISEDPLYVTVADMAEAAAFHDSRFSSVTLDEFRSLDVEISILGPISRCFDPAHVVVGRHGLIICRGDNQGLLLPQVAVEWEWDRDMFLEQACRKAGLPPDAWHDPDTEIYWFEALVI